MNSRERVLTTINHQQPDRVPIGEWGIDHDHVSKIIGRHTYWRNRKDSTIALWEGRRDDVVESEKNDYVELIEKLDYDIIPVHLVPPKGYQHPDPPQKIADGAWEDSKGNVFKYAASNDSIMCMTAPEPKSDVTEEDIDRAIENLPGYDESQFELIDHICEKYGNTKAIVFRGHSIDGLMMSLFGGDETHRLMMTAMNPDMVYKAGKYALAANQKMIDHLKTRDILILMNGRDYGNSTGCIESPDSIRKLYMPWHKKLCEAIENAGRIPFLHCCGCVWDIMDDFVNAGYKGYQSIQGTAGMKIEKVKALYGDKLTLWAGVQCETLVEGTAEEVDNEINHSLEVAMPGGGFIFGSTNSVQFGAKTENYLRALDIVRKKGVYK